MDNFEKLPALVYTDADGPHVIPLARSVTSIGRLADRDVVLKEAFVSRRHAVINRNPEGYEVVDEGSSHGTFVNGERVERARLKQGDRLQFGSLSAPEIHFKPAYADGERTDVSRAGDLLSALSVFIPSGKTGRPAAREMEQLNFLLSAARQLNAGGAVNDIFRALLRLSIQLTGVERGYVFLCEHGDLRLALGLRSDGTDVQEDSTVSRRAIQRSLESASKFYVSDTLADSDAGAWASVVVNSIRSIYCIPLRKHVSSTEPNRLLGLLYLDSQIGAGSLSEIDHQLLDTISTEAATLLDNALLDEAEIHARKAAEELAVAASIHSSLMSIAMPTLAYAGLQARTVPCLAIGGDFYDAVAMEDCLCVAIADVSGKGVPASIVAATLQGIIHAQMLTGQGLAEIADLVNRFLCTRKVDKYATMVLLKLYPSGNVEYVNCGHVSPLVISAGGVRKLTEGNVIVGLIPWAAYKSAHCKLAPGERILLATDGITEAENSQGEQFGDARFEHAVQVESIDDLLEELAKFQSPNSAQDDWTLVDVHYLGDEN